MLVSGAAGGIGRALARHLAACGARVAGLDVAPLPAGVDGLAVRADITDPDQIARALARIERDLGPVEVLVNNAAVTDLAHHPLVDLPLEQWRRVFEVNVTGTVALTQAVLAGMLERHRGNILTITSSLGQPRGGVPGDAVYSASKAALEATSFVLAQEVAASGVNVNTLYPSVKVDTGFFAHLPASERAALAPATLLDEPAEFLASLPAGSLTGVALSQHHWDHTPGYADDLRRRAEQGGSS